MQKKRISQGLTVTMFLMILIILVVASGCGTTQPKITDTATLLLPKAKDIVESYNQDLVVEIKTTKVKQIEQNAELSNFTVAISHDGRNLAYAVRESGNKWAMVVNDVKGPTFESVFGPIFSQDGSRYAYSAMRAGKWMTILDGQMGEVFDIVTPVTFSIDGKKWAYAARTGNKWLFVTEAGKRDIPFEAVSEVSPMVFSPDGSHEAYVVITQTGSAFVVVDGLKGPIFERVTLPTFSPDGSKFAYFAAAEDEVYLIVNHKRVLTYEKAQLADLRFSSDGNKLVYTVFTSNNNSFVEVVDLSNGQMKKDCQFGPLTVHVFSLQPFTNATITGTPWCPIFTPDSKNVLFGVNAGPPSLVDIPFRPIGPGQFYYIKDSLGSAIVSLNGTRLATVNPVGVLTPFFFSPDGKEIRWFQLTQDGLFMKQILLK